MKMEINIILVFSYYLSENIRLFKGKRSGVKYLDSNIFAWFKMFKGRKEVKDFI